MDDLYLYKRELVNEVTERAGTDGILDQEAFFNTACDILRDSGILNDYEYAYCHQGKGTSGFIACDGDDPSAFDQDESVVIIACDEGYSLRAGSVVTQIHSNEVRNYFKAMRRYIIHALKGAFGAVDESDPSYALADSIRSRAHEISRFRLYFITDREYTGRGKTLQELTSIPLDGGEEEIRVESYLIDIRRLKECSESSSAAETTSIILRDSIHAVKAPGSDPEITTYLMFVPGSVLADWYQEHGSKLMESNVRSFLSMKGKVNDGIRKTLNGEPSKFVAFNNGLTATASGVVTDNFGCISRLDNLQIVNGGQTTASIYYTRQKDKNDLSQVLVPMKLVVVRPDTAKELVPNISRFTNSQNKVAEADFSSTSEYQIALERLSRGILTPLVNGSGVTHWYYERARGQYDNEKNRLPDAAERRRFEKLNPKKQRIKMVDAPKYLVCWEQKPYVASLGSQKCFAEYAKEVSENDNITELLTPEYFKRLVCKKIIFDTTYRSVRKQGWYRGGYQANITEYAISKYAFDLERAHEQCDFETIWRNQSLDDAIVRRLMLAARQASDVLNDGNRPYQNISEWAKKQQCWEWLTKYPTCLNATETENDIAEAEDKKMGNELAEMKAAGVVSAPRHKAINAIPDVSGMSLADWKALPKSTCKALLTFSTDHHFISEKSRMSLNALLDDTGVGKVNVNALNFLLQRAMKEGFQPEDVNSVTPMPEARSAPSPQNKETVESPAREEPEYVHWREFFESIPAQTWRTIMEWASRHNMLTQEVTACIGLLDARPDDLTDGHVETLVRFREQMITAKFPTTQFAPPPSHHI